MAESLKDAKGDIARLSDGIAQMPRRLSAREIRADALFLYLQLLSRFSFIVTAIGGFWWRGWTGCVVGVAPGWLLGMLMRHSMGLRHRDPTLGFFIRMQQRADGSRPGILERLVERVRGNAFTREKCREITEAFSEAKRLLAMERSESGRMRILTALDAKVKAVSYRS